MVADHWFRQIERILRAMEITSDTTWITLASFQLEGESQIWWEWVMTSRDWETMSWDDFRRLFMGKYFSDSARHAKAREFLELRQGTMTVLEYVARFTELARFGDDYVATDAAKVRRFEDGLKLSIRGKIVGHNLQDMDSMVSTALIIEPEIENARSIRDAGASSKRKESQSSSSSGKKSKASNSRGFQSRGHRGKGQSRVLSQEGRPGPMTCFYCHQPGHMKLDCRRGMDLRVLDRRILSHQWNRRGHSLFLHPLVWVRGTSMGPRVLCEHLTPHRQARGVRAWVEVEDRAHRLGHQGFRDVSTPSRHRLSQQISQLYRVCFCYLAYGQGYYLTRVHRIHSSLHQL